MARLTATFKSGAAFNIECRGHSVVTDQPASNGGEDSGMTPPEFFAGSLAGCIGYYVARYCQQAGIATDDLRVDCDWSVTEDSPRRIGEFTIDVVLPGLPEKRRKAVERVASSCLIHATLHNTPDININLNTGQEDLT